MSFGFGFGFPRSDTVADGGVPGGGASLRLNFLSSQTLDPRITFSRTSNATQFDSSGNLVYAPHNLLTFSEQFDNSAWGKNAITIGANATAAPDGTVTADKIQETAVTNFFAISSNPSGSYSTAYTHSIYAKAGERTSMQVSFTVSVAAATFNLSNGTVTSSSGSSLISASIQSVGNGWYRCITRLTTVASGANPLFHIVGTVNDAGSTTFAGVAGNGIFIWGAQLNIGTLQPYYPTTVKNLLGFAQEFDNAAWPKSNSFVQTNQIRNNTMQGAVAGSPGTVPTNWATVALGVSRQIVGSGIENGVSYIDIRFFGTPSSSADIQVLFEPNNGIAAANLTTYTESVFVALVGGSLTNISAVRLAVGTYSAAAAFLQYLTGANIGGSITSTMQRFSTSVTTSNASTAFAQPAVGLSATSGQAVDFTLRVGWPQLVQGAVAGDPVATYGTARAVMYPAPDGSVTGDKLVENTAAGEHYIEQYPIVIIGTPYLFSVYAKAGERTNIYLRTAITFADQFTHFNLSNGTITSSTHGSGNSGTVAIGNGWYRCWVRAIATSSGASVCRFQMWNGSAVYTGDGTSGIFIWGAQLSDSASLDPYVYNPVAAPTAAAYYGPRFDYDPATLAPRGLLIEEQRTNSIRNNTMVGAVAPSTFPTNWQSVIVAGLTNTVVGTGVENGITYLDVRVSGTPAVSTFYNLVPDILVAGASGQTWAGSFWAKLVAGSLTNTAANIELRESDAAQGFLTNSIASVPISSTLTRYSLVRTLTNASTAFASIRFVWQVTNGLPVDFTFRIGLPQLELGAFATSVIPTTTAAATRTADLATMVGANFSNWYRQDEGTLFSEILCGVSAVTNTGILSVYQASSPTNNRISTRISNTILTSDGTAVAFFFLSASPNTIARWATAYRINDFAQCSNGGSPVTDTSGAVPTSINEMEIGGVEGTTTLNLNGYIRQITYFPRRLANSELQTVTL